MTCTCHRGTHHEKCLTVKFDYPARDCDWNPTAQQDDLVTVGA